MPRKRWIQHPITGDLVPESEYIRPNTTLHSVITDDMNAVLHPCDGQIYTSKSKFRRTTRSHGCTEVGNESMERIGSNMNFTDAGKDVARALNEYSDSDIRKAARKMVRDIRGT